MSSEEECSCVETSAIKADVTKLELGPAYNDVSPRGKDCEDRAGPGCA